MATPNSPAVYVGTFHKYNSGSLFGAWMKLDEFSSRDEFIEAALKLHKDEEDPELMFQDWENVSDFFISESYVEPDLWDWLELDEGDRQLLIAYRNDVEADGTIDDARDHLIGRYESFREYADEVADEMLHGVAEFAQRYFDYAAFARDLEYDYTVADCEDGDVFIFYN